MHFLVSICVAPLGPSGAQGPQFI